MAKYLLSLALAVSLSLHGEETPCRASTDPVVISSSSFTDFASATLQIATSPSSLQNLPLVYAGLTADASVKIGYSNDLSTLACFEQAVTNSPSDSLAISSLSDTNSNSALVAWRDVALKKVCYTMASIQDRSVILSSTTSLDNSNDVQEGSLKAYSTQNGHVLLWTESRGSSLKYAFLSSKEASPSVYTAMTAGSLPMNYLVSKDCDGGLHLLAYNQEIGAYYMNKGPTADKMTAAIKMLPKLKSSSIQSVALAAAKEGFVAIVLTYKDAKENSYMVTLHKYPTQAAPVEQDRQPIAELMLGKTIKLTIDPESNETTTTFIARKDSGKAAIHLYTRKTITIAPKDEMVSLPLNADSDATDVDVLLTHIDGTREDFVALTSSTTPIPAYISMRTIKYDFFSKFRQMLPMVKTSSITHLTLESVLGGVIISYLDATGALMASTLSVTQEI